MTGQIITSTHQTYNLPVLLRWEITYTGGVPCDCFSVTFLYDSSMAEPLHLAAGFAAVEGGDIMLRGIEAIGISARAGQKVEKDLRETEDAVLYSTGMEDERQVVLREGELLVCLPGDIHRPGCRVDGAQTIKKAILKVLIA